MSIAPDTLDLGCSSRTQPHFFSERSPRRLGSSAFSLLEVLVAFAITLVVIGLALPLVATFHRVYNRESEKADLSARATRALDDVLQELARAGYGLGGGIEAIVPSNARSDTAGSDAILIRSNPKGVATKLSSAYDAGWTGAVDVGPIRDVSPGEALLVVDDLGGSTVVRLKSVDERVDGRRLHLEPWDDTAVKTHRFLPERGARLVPIRQVRYYVEEVDGRRMLVKQALDQPPRGLTDVEHLAFQFFDRDGEQVAANTLSIDRKPSRVGVAIAFVDGSELGRTQWVTSVAMNPQSGSISFAVPGLGARLVKTYSPIQSPLTILTQPRRDWGVIVSAGQNAYQDPSYLYAFLSTERPMEARVESVVFLDKIRPPTAACMAPPSSPWPNSLFLISGGIRVGELFRLDPDGEGFYSASSGERSFGGVEGLTEVSGIGVGSDSRLYVGSRMEQSVFRVAVSDERVEEVERIERFTGAVTALTAGFDGAIYFGVAKGSRAELWRIGFDHNSQPIPAERIRSLDGYIVNLSRDPLSGRLLMLLREPLGDEAVLRIATMTALEPPPPEELFRLSRFREQTLEGGGEGQAVQIAEGPLVTDGARLSVELLPETLDFVGMDSLGFLFLGSVEKKLVLQFDLDRPDDLRHRVVVAATIESRAESGAPEVRLHASKPEIQGR